MLRSPARASLLMPPFDVEPWHKVAIPRSQTRNASSSRFRPARPNDRYRVHAAQPNRSEHGDGLARKTGETGGTKNDERTSAVGRPPRCGARRPVRSGKPAPNHRGTTVPDARITAISANPLLVNDPLNLRGRKTRESLRTWCRKSRNYCGLGWAYSLHRIIARYPMTAP